MTTGNNDTGSDREDAFLEDLYRQLADRFAEDHAADYDADTSRARFMTWLTAHTAGHHATAIQQSPVQTRHAGSSENQAKIRVFLLHSHEGDGRGPAAMLNSQPGIEVAGEAATVASAMNRLPDLRPDVAVLDVQLPDGDGVAACREIRTTLPGTACLMLIGHDDGQALLEAARAGAAGFVTKQVPATELASAVRTVAAGQLILGPDAARMIMKQLRARAVNPGPVPAPSAQEKRVLDLIGEGLTSRQIAQIMFVSEKTVNTHVSSLLGKLGLHRRSQATAIVVHRAGRSSE